ncbi:MAG TPA: hypothetical protein VF410_08600 [Rhizomicrobium sp.]|jgi:hypothetical protein
MSETNPSLEVLATRGTSLPEYKARLSRYFAVASGGHVEFRSAADPGNLPQFIKLVGDIAIWTPFVVFASAFLKRIAEKAADVTWDVFKNKLSKADRNAQAFVEVVSVLIDASADMQRGVAIVGLNYPHSYWGTVLVIRDQHPEEIAKSVCLFIENVKEIDKVVHDAIEAGSRTHGYVHVEFDTDAHCHVHWIDQDFNIQKRELS